MKSRKVSKMATKLNKKAKSPKKQADTSGKRAYGDAELTGGECGTKSKAKKSAKKVMKKAKAKVKAKAKRK